jgi:uncharacterized protein (TIGR02271 family)
VATTNRTTVVGVFRNPDEARDAISALKDAGFSGNDIGLLMKDRDETREMARETGSHAGEGAATGAVGGGILGGLAGWLVGIGAIAIPGVGPFIAAGALGTALAGAAIGAGVGAVAGALIGMGIPEEEAEWYEGEVRSGRTLVTVKADTRYDEAHTILRNHGAYDVEDRGTTGVGTTYDSGTENRGRGETVTPGDTYWNRGMDTGYRDLGGWDEVSPRYRERWQQRHGTSGRRWEDDEHGYRYGWEMRNRPEYRDRPFNEVEPELRRDWETRHADRPWAGHSESVRSIWEDDDRSVGSRGTRGIEEQTMQLREEELRGRKERERTGTVGMHKEVVSEEETLDVPVTREEPYVERRRVDRPSGRPVGEDESMHMPVYEEQVYPEKETHVSEEITMGKRRVEDTERVSDTVRREEARFGREGDFEITGGEGFPDHEHNFAGGDRCTICGATRRPRRAA